MIPAELASAYREGLEQISSAARAELASLWSRAARLGDDELRDYLVQVFPSVAGTYGDAAASLAAEFYGAVREDQIGGRYTALLAGSVPFEQAEATVRYAAGRIYEGRREDALAYLDGQMDRYVKQPARETITRNALRDPARPRFARVPTGAETCAFCMMLASRGFVYASEASAGEFDRYHPGCDCAVVIDFTDDPALEGYDPDALHDLFADARRQAQSGDAKDVLAEMRRLHPEILTDGAAGRIDYRKPRSSFAGAQGRLDLAAHDALADSGLRLTVLPETAPEGYSNIDLLIGGELWEVKSPDGSNIRAVESNLRKAKRQFQKVHGRSDVPARVVFNGTGFGIDDDEVEREIRRRMRQHGISEVIQVLKDGTTRWIVP